MSEIRIVMAGSGGRSLVAEFYSRDTTDRWIEIKEDLYTRLAVNKDTLESIEHFSDSFGMARRAIKDEIEFLQGIIDKIERS